MDLEDKINSLDKRMESMEKAQITTEDMRGIFERIEPLEKAQIYLEAKKEANEEIEEQRKELIKGEREAEIQDKRKLDNRFERIWKEFNKYVTYKVAISTITVVAFFMSIILTALFKGFSK